MGELERGRLNEHIEKVAAWGNDFLADFDEAGQGANNREMIQKNAYVLKGDGRNRGCVPNEKGQWNRELFVLPFKIAARRGYRTRKTFVASKLLKEGKGIFL